LQDEAPFILAQLELVDNQFEHDSAGEIDHRSKAFVALGEDLVPKRLKEVTWPMSGSKRVLGQ
jgi:hypothetical protein